MKQGLKEVQCVIRNVSYKRVVNMNFGCFLSSVAETIVGYLLCCGLGIIQCPLNFLYYIIGYCKFSTTPRNYHSFLAVLYPVLY